MVSKVNKGFMARGYVFYRLCLYPFGVDIFIICNHCCSISAAFAIVLTIFSIILGS